MALCAPDAIQSITAFVLTLITLWYGQVCHVILQTVLRIVSLLTSLRWVTTFSNRDRNILRIRRAIGIFSTDVFSSVKLRFGLEQMLRFLIRERELRFVLINLWRAFLS